jgi:hypothetical protein
MSERHSLFYCYCQYGGPNHVCYSLYLQSSRRLSPTSKILNIWRKRRDIMSVCRLTRSLKCERSVLASQSSVWAVVKVTEGLALVDVPEVETECRYCQVILCTCKAIQLKSRFQRTGTWSAATRKISALSSKSYYSNFYFIFNTVYIWSCIP